MLTFYVYEARGSERGRGLSLLCRRRGVTCRFWEGQGRFLEVFFCIHLFLYDCVIWAVMTELIIDVYRFGFGKSLFFIL